MPAVGTSDSSIGDPSALSFWGPGLARPSRAQGINPCALGSPAGLPAGLAQTRPRAAWRPSPPSPAPPGSPSPGRAGGSPAVVNPAGARERLGPRAARAGSHFLRGAGGAGRALRRPGEAAPGSFPPSSRTMPWIQGGPGEGAAPRDHATHLGRLMTAHPGPSRRAPPPRPPGARSAPVRAPRRLPHRPAGRGRSPGRQSRARRPGRGPSSRLRHQFPGCSLGPSRDAPGLSFLTCELDLGAGGAGRGVLLPFCIADCGGAGVREGISDERIPEASGLAARHSPRRSKSCRSPRAQTPLYTLLPQDKELADWPTPPRRPLCTQAHLSRVPISALSTLDPSIQQALNKHGRGMLESYSSVACLSLPLPFWL